MVVLATLALVCLAGFAAWFPRGAAVVWILVLETSPDIWLTAQFGGHETIIAVLKAAGLVLALLMGVRFGPKPDRYNPGFAFAAMFLAGLSHGLYPGLDFAGSLRSLLGSAAPFAFGFVRLPSGFRRGIVAAVLCGPLVTVALGLLLNLAGMHAMFDFEAGAVRLGGSGQPPFLAGFALIAIYAGLLEWVQRGRGGVWLAVNFVILLATGGRAPLALAAVLAGGVLVLQRRVLVLAAAAAELCGAVIFSGALGFLRVVNLAQAGLGTNLSNRGLVWPYFERAFASSPWFGWGVGAGKVVVPVGSSLSALIGTNAAHDEYLRIGAEGGVIGLALLIGLMAAWVVRGSQAMPAAERWLVRAVFIAFAIHSATDNTLIATTSSVFFIWVSAVFATAGEPVKAPV